MDKKQILENYRRTDREYANTLLTAIMAIGEDEVMKKLEQAEKEGKRLELTYPIPPGVGPSEPNGVRII